MAKKIIKLSIILGFYLFLCQKIYIQNKYPTKQNKNQEIKEIKQIKKENIETNPQKEIGLLIIKKINLIQKLYPINSQENNIEKHITILKDSKEPSEENSIFILAAHSGTGPLAYFKDLNQLEKQDEIILTYQNITYTYNVQNILESNQNGYIRIPEKNKKQLILTTCSPTKEKMQLTIYCTEKESN